MTALLIFVVLLLAALMALVAISYFLAPRREAETKKRRFEAGNPPYGRVERRLLMQYFGYIYLATAFEAVVGVMIVAVLVRGVDAAVAGALGAALIAIAVVVAKYLKAVADIRRWS
ncbi:MAG: NADH-quinone oxidoreductase subunit A [Thermoproteus sp.]